MSEYDVPLPRNILENIETREKASEMFNLPRRTVSVIIESTDRSMRGCFERLLSYHSLSENRK